MLNNLINKLEQKYCYAQENQDYLKSNIFRLKDFLSKNSMQYLYNLSVLGYPLAKKISNKLNDLGSEENLNKVYDILVDLISNISDENKTGYKELKEFIYNEIRDSHLGHKKSFLKSYIEGGPRNLHTLFNVLTNLANSINKALGKEKVNFEEVGHEPMLADFGEIERFVLEHGDKAAIKNLDSLSIVLEKHPELARKLSTIVHSFNRGHKPNTDNLKEEITSIIKNYMDNTSKSNKNFNYDESFESQIGLPKDKNKEKEANGLKSLLENNMKEVLRLNKLINLLNKQKTNESSKQAQDFKEKAQKIILENLDLEDKIKSLEAELFV